jgi:hypothetical protein
LDLRNTIFGLDGDKRMPQEEGEVNIMGIGKRWKEMCFEIWEFI